MSSDSYQLKFPTDPKKIRARIRSYERKLIKERRETGYWGDGYGKRFLLAPLYMLMGDLEGCLKHIAWYEDEMPDDCPYAAQYLCWTLAVLRSGDIAGARWRLSQTMLASVYVIPVLLGRPVEMLDVWMDWDEHGNPDGWDQHWADMEIIPDRIYDLWTEEEKAWAAQQYDSEEFTSFREFYLDLFRDRQDRSPSTVDMEVHGLRYNDEEYLASYRSRREEARARQGTIELPTGSKLGLVVKPLERDLIRKNIEGYSDFGQMALVHGEYLLVPMAVQEISELESQMLKWLEESDENEEVEALREYAGVFELYECYAERLSEEEDGTD